MVAKLGDACKPKRVLEEAEENEELKAKVKELTHDKILTVAKSALNKSSRKEQFKAVKEEMKEALLEAFGEEYMDENGGMASTYYGKLQKEVIRNMMLSEQMRLDGRKFDEVRPIWNK